MPFNFYLLMNVSLPHSKYQEFASNRRKDILLMVEKHMSLFVRILASYRPLQVLNLHVSCIRMSILIVMLLYLCACAHHQA